MWHYDPLFDPNTYLEYELGIDTLEFNFRKMIKKCECGAKHTSFPNFHMSFCQLHKEDKEDL